nr:hypothetical protein [Thecaphora frezii]
MKLALSPSLLPLLASAAVVAWISARANPLQARQHCLSCSGCSSDSCRTNQPGGLLLLTGFWDYSPATGPDDAWTIHGLWPDSCSGAQVSSCGTDRNYQNIGTILRNNGAEDVLDYMNQYWFM